MSRHRAKPHATPDAAPAPQPVSQSVAGVDVAEAYRLLSHTGHAHHIEHAANDTERLQRIINALCDLSMHDGLTGLGNVRLFRMTLEREVVRAARTGEPCALLILDLDHFKKINDTYGHPAGDRVLQAVARRMAEQVRPMDTVTRYGGEEFAVILPNSLPSYATLVAERIRARIAEEPIPIDQASGKAEPIRVTVSIGVAGLQPWAPLNADALLQAADQNLYQAKTRGRNQVWSETEPTTAILSDERTALFQQFQKDNP